MQYKNNVKRAQVDNGIQHSRVLALKKKERKKKDKKMRAYN